MSQAKLVKLIKKITRLFNKLHNWPVDGDMVEAFDTAYEFDAVKAEIIDEWDYQVWEVVAASLDNMEPTANGGDVLA